jgi:hypothetical protein
MPFPILNIFNESSFNIGEGSVFVQKNQDEGKPFPPSEGYFLLLDNTNFLLLNGQNLTLL